MKIKIEHFTPSRGGECRFAHRRRGCRELRWRPQEVVQGHPALIISRYHLSLDNCLAPTSSYMTICENRTFYKNTKQGREVSICAQPRWRPQEVVQGHPALIISRYHLSLDNCLAPTSSYMTICEVNLLHWIERFVCFVVVHFKYLLAFELYLTKFK